MKTASISGEGGRGGGGGGVLLRFCMLSYMLYMITSYGNVSFSFINFGWNHRVVVLSNSCT